jgi:hypothetical protein
MLEALRTNSALLKLDLYCQGVRLDGSCYVEEDGGRKILRTRAGLPGPPFQGGQAASTSRIFAARRSAEKGFSRNSCSPSRMPWRSTALSV